MGTLILFLLTLVFYTSCAQQDAGKPKTLTDKFVVLYNQKAYDSIFNLFSDEMKTALPADKTTEFFSGLQLQAGEIKKYEFKKMMQTYRQYKTDFSTAIFMLSISQDVSGKINGLFVAPYKEEEEKPVMPRNISKMNLPFSGEWFVFWGGDTKEQNYHVSYGAQKNAFDIMIMGENGKTHKTDGKTNDDYFAFGQPITAPCDAEVVMAVDGVKDNTPGEMNTMFVTGNTIVLKTANNEYLLFAHFKQHSIKVKQGDKVKQGQLLGLCGNSGNSSEAHLHFHIQNKENMTDAKGIKCFFDKLLVNGTEKKDYSPVKGDRIKNIN
jgi:murein DD-endopeptidase MepM/ murein hydrolase activator NlpD